MREDGVDISEVRLHQRRPVATNWIGSTNNGVIGGARADVDENVGVQGEEVCIGRR